MPATSSRANLKAEATNNVTSNFYDLNLHNASASGNLGLVGFALTRGQPVNSLLDGMLPLHFASSGGSDVVVRKLIEHGADVNAPSVNPPKLPRKHSNEKTPTVATAGSTPLHFAAGNGHKNVVSTLLANGAHASRPDKAGITPEMLARQRGWPETADLLKDWAAKAELVHTDADRDANAFDSSDRLGAQSSMEGESIRKRTQIKNSIDRSLGGARQMILKVSSSALHDAYKTHTSSSTSTPPPVRDSPSPYGKPLGEYTFYPTSTPSPSRSEFGDIDDSTRRPSLPHIHNVPQRPRRVSGNTGPPSSRRPRSAGTGAEQQPEQVPSSPRHQPKKLGSKYSLLGLFKKGQQDSPERIPVPLGSANSTPPNIDSDTSSPLARPSTRHRQGTDSSLRPTAVDLHNSLARDRSGSNASVISRLDTDDSLYGDFDTSPRQRPGSPNGRVTIRRTHIRDRSGSRSSNTGNNNTNRGGAVFDDDMIVVPGTTPQRPGIGILKGHNRSASSGQSNASPPGSGAAFQTLRFNATSPPTNGSSGSFKANLLGLRASNSVGSFAQFQEEGDQTEKPLPAAPNFLVPESAPPATSDFGQLVKEDEDDDYGRPIKESSLHLEVSQTNTRPRASSFTSDSSSLSPVMDSSEVDGLPSTSAFPFSIEEPPPDTPLVPPARINADNRGRGDSLSSTSTTDSTNLLMSASGTTSGSGSITVMTPGLSPPAHSVLGSSPRQRIKNIQVSDDDREEDSSGGTNVAIRVNEKRVPAPLDIDVRSISHAQAEALVQQRQQRILEMGSGDVPYTATTSNGAGWTPLSAKLAAYGESLALERRLREEKGLTEPSIPESPTRRSPTRSKVALFMRDAGFEPPKNGHLDRQRSLDQRPGKSRRVPKAPKRPNTSNGTPSHELSHMGGEQQTTKGPHHVARSASATVHPSHESTTPQNTPFVADESDDEYAHPIVRSHTPDDFELEIPVTFDDSPLGTPLGTPLYRTTTAPNDTSARRQIPNANKLTRMGFSPDPAPRAPPPNKPKFLKHLMQTFKGKA